MDVKAINELLARGEIDREDMWPRIVEMESKAAQFRFEFGLEEFPTEPGLITIRGPRQYGKSTWLELHLRDSIEDHGRASAFYLNGDELASPEELYREMTTLRSAYAPEARVKRLFIDEVTAVPDWERAVKRAIDQGRFRDVLIVTTGSKASDLRRGSKRLPGRKGRLRRSEFIFLPISYREFRHVVGRELGDKTWMAYLLTGGSPIACNDIYQFKRLPEYFIQLTRDWIFGEVVLSGRSRVALAQLLQVLMRSGGSPVGFAKLAREAGLANNTVASGYVEQLADLMAILPSWPWDPAKKGLQLRKPCKFHFVNLAVVMAFHPAGIRQLHEFEALTPETQGILIEWLVAQEMWRRAVLEQAENPEAIGFWSSREHEIDFISPTRQFIEVKRGRVGALDFTWFPKVFPKSELTVICGSPFRSAQVTGITLERFLLSAPTRLTYADEEETPTAA